MVDRVLDGFAKACLYKEALASCQLEGIGLDLTIKDLYLAELGLCEKKCAIDIVKRFQPRKEEVEAGTDTSPAMAGQDDKVNALNRSGDLKEPDAGTTSTQILQSSPSEMADVKCETPRQVVERIKWSAVDKFFAKYPSTKWEGFTPESRMVVENAIELAFKECDARMFDRIVLHPSADECDIDECWICAIRDCPYHEPLHYHHDGCPSCFGDDYALMKRIEKWKNTNKSPFMDVHELAEKIISRHDRYGLTWHNAIVTELHDYDVSEAEKK